MSLQVSKTITFILIALTGVLALANMIMLSIIAQKIPNDQEFLDKSSTYLAVANAVVLLFLIPISIIVFKIT